MNIALFGGTFDPIHSGHLSVARAARNLFSLDQVHFIPAGRPPHRGGEQITSFLHRFAMVALACSGERGFVASPVEAPGRTVNYSIQTVRRFRRALESGDRLYFVIGADAFLEFRTWRDWRALLNTAHFIVVSRPGADLDRAEAVLPADLRSRESGRANGKHPGGQVREIRLRRTSLWLLRGIEEPVSATAIRAQARGRREFKGTVPAAVAEYISKQDLYR